MPLSLFCTILRAITITTNVQSICLGTETWRWVSKTTDTIQILEKCVPLPHWMTSYEDSLAAIEYILATNAMS